MIISFNKCLLTIVALLFLGILLVPCSLAGSGDTYYFTALSDNMLMEIFYIGIGLVLFAVAVFTKDSVIGGLTGFANAIIMFYAIFNNDFSMGYDTIIFMLGFISVPVAVYQIWIGATEYRINK